MNNYNNQNNFNSAFMNNQPFIDKYDFKNRNNIIHNNINDNTMLEQITEYYLNIDSNDRSLSAYPNPFNFTVTFGGVGASTERKTYVRKNIDIVGTSNIDKKERIKINYEGTPGPVINRKFRNIKYLRVDYLILPKTNKIIEESDPSNYSISTDDDDRLTRQYKYLMLRINEIRSDKILGTNKNLESDVFILYPDKHMGRGHTMWFPTTGGTRTYKNSTLENINKLTFEILTPDGEILHIINSYDNPTNVQNDDLQVNIAIVLGVVENELNTNTKFEY